jgi:hypothetical protein
MGKVLSFIILFVMLEHRLFAAEAGMHQLDPKYWPSQVFWLIIIFLSVYLLIAKIFIPKIQDNIESREDKIRKDLEEAKLLGEESEKKLKTYKDLSFFSDSSPSNFASSRSFLILSSLDSILS